MERMESSSLKVYLLKEKIVCPRYGQQGQRYAELGWYREKIFFVPRIGMKRSFYMKTRGRIMLDIKMIRQNFDKSPNKITDSRSKKKEVLEEFLKLDERRRQLLVETEELKKVRNEVSAEIAQLKRAKKAADDKITEMKEVGTKNQVS